MCVTRILETHGVLSFTQCHKATGRFQTPGFRSLAADWLSRWMLRFESASRESCPAMPPPSDPILPTPASTDPQTRIHAGSLWSTALWLLGFFHVSIFACVKGAIWTRRTTIERSGDPFHRKDSGAAPKTNSDMIWFHSEWIGG